MGRALKLILAANTIRGQCAERVLGGRSGWLNLIKRWVRTGVSVCRCEPTDLPARIYRQQAQREFWFNGWTTLLGCQQRFLPVWCRMHARIPGNAVNRFGKSAGADFRRPPAGDGRA